MFSNLIKKSNRKQKKDTINNFNFKNLDKKKTASIENIDELVDALLARVSPKSYEKFSHAKTYLRIKSGLSIKKLLSITISFLLLFAIIASASSLVDSDDILTDFLDIENDDFFIDNSTSQFNDSTNVSYDNESMLNNSSSEPEINESINTSDIGNVNESLNQSINETVVFSGLNLTLEVDKEIYVVNESVFISGIVLYNNTQVNSTIDLVIISPNNSSSLSLDVFNGGFDIEFVPIIAGSYYTIANVFYLNETAQEEIGFNVIDENLKNDSLNISNLYIWDDTDFQNKYVGDQITFYANYSSDDQVIENASCFIFFDLGGWTEPIFMNYSNGLYFYNSTFDKSGVFDFKVQCSASGFENKTSVGEFVISEVVNDVSIIDAEEHEQVYVLPGTSFYVERTINGTKGTEAVFAPFYSDGLTIEKIEIINENIVSGKKSLLDKDISPRVFSAGKGVSNVERRIDSLRENLPAVVKKLNRVSYTKLFNLDGPITVRIWFRAPSWNDIKSGSLPSSGHISYLTFTDDSFDFESSTWWNSNWNNRKLITINSSQVEGTLTNFPVLINITDTDLRDDAQDDGDDVAFVLYSDNTTKLNHEIELFNGTTGELFAWVNLSSLSSSVDTKIWMYYNNSACSNQQNVNGTWDSNFMMVQHLNETSGTHEDSTSNDKDGSPQGGITQTAIGKIDGGDQGDGGNDYIQVTDSGQILSPSSLTFEIWINILPGWAQYDRIVDKKNTWDGASGWSWELGGTEGSSTFLGSGSSGAALSLGWSQGAMHYVVATVSGTTVTAYLDGNQADSGTINAIATNNIDLRILAGDTNPGFRFTPAIIDEIRISNTPRNVSWINTCYNNQNNQSTFISVDSEENITSTSVDLISPYTVTYSPFTIKATGNSSLDNVTLWYRYSTDNSSWDGGAYEWNNNSIDSNSSDVDSIPDKGIESSFSNAQGITIDSNLMTIQEVNTGGNPGDNFNDTVDDNTANKDASADKGTETNFVNCQDVIPDADVMTLQEVNQGTPAVNENKVVNGFTATTTGWSTVGSSPYLSADDGTNYIQTSTTNADMRWFTFADTTNTGSGFSVVMYVDFDAGDGNDDCNWYIDTTGDNTAEFSGQFSNPTTNIVNTGTIAGLDTQTEINAARVWFRKLTTFGEGNMRIDYAYLNIQRAAAPDWELDVEYQFNGSEYNCTNEQVCLYLTGSVTESLLVDYWSGSWTNLGTINNAGWNNFTATGLTSSTYNIRIRDQNQTGETTQHSWTIDCLFLHCWNTSNYEIDFEYQWTTANFTEDTKIVCIYVAGHTGGTETLNVNYRNGGIWTSLGTITSTGWNNFTATGLTSSTYTLQFIGATESSDFTQDIWTIDCIFLYTYNSTGGSNGLNWSIWSDASNPDTSSPWSWSFNFLNGTGYYEFYSIGKKSGSPDESAPASADAICYFDESLNTVPLITLINPSPNGTINVNLQPICQVWANDSDGDTLTVYWYENTTGSWVLRNTNNSISANTIVSYNFSQFNTYSTTFWWKVAVNDTLDNTTVWYYFTTLPINTSINTINPYHQTSSPLEINATGPSDLDNVTLLYRWSKDNSTWSGQQMSIFEDFESATQNTSLWNTYQNGGLARIQFDYGTAHSGSYSCAMDDSEDFGDNALNVIYTNYDFTGVSNINIDFWEREWGDEAHEAPDSWAGWGNYDVVAFTNDGNTWYEIVSEANLNTETFTNFQYNISADPDFSSPPNSNFAIAFQQYDNSQLTNDGRAWDDIYINFTISDSGWTQWDNTSNPDTGSPWSWNFNYPNGTGYYEFYSIGNKSGSPNETAPGSADAICKYNNLPTITNEIPSNGSTNIQVLPQMNITINDADGDLMTITWYSNSSGSWQVFGTNSSVGNGTYHQTNSNFSEPLTTYWWYVNVSDIVDTSTSGLYYYFSTGLTTPTVTTNTSTGVEETNATLHGYLSTNGGEVCTVRFEYGTTTNYGTNTTNQSKTAGNEFTDEITSLTPGQIYHYRAYANNTYGSAVGTDMMFLTKPQPPTSLVAQTNNSNSIYLTWITGAGANNTYIERNTTGLTSWDIGQGTMIYNGSGTNYEDTGLTPGFTYYYQAWSYATWTDITTLQQWSDNNASNSNTTNIDPTIELITPFNGSTNIGLQPICQIWANDTDGNTLNVYWYENTTGDWVLRQTNASISANTTVSWTFSQASSYGFNYWWKVAVNDTKDNITAWYYFTTQTLNTSVDSITPYIITTSPLTITATNNTPVDNVTLYYRWSDDNSSWGHSGETIYDTPALDNVSSETNNQGASFMTWTHSVGTDLTNSILIVGTNVEEGVHNNYYVQSADFNGDALTYAIRVAADEGYAAVSEIWYLLNPDPGTHTVRVNFSQSVQQALGGAASFYNLEQGAPYHTNTATNLGSPTGLSTSVNTEVANSLMIAVATDGQGTLAYSYGTGQAQIYDVAGSSHEGAGSYKLSTGSGSSTLYTNLSGATNRMSQVVASWTPTSTTWGNGTDWIEWNDATNPDTGSPWSWDFDFPNSTGYYEFYSIGKKSGSLDEVAPGSADTNCVFNRIPTITNEVPVNQSMEIHVLPQMNITINDADGDLMSLTWYSNSSGSWQVFGTNISVGNGTYHQINNNFSNFSTTYWWYVTVSDGFNTNTSDVFYFTTDVINTSVDPISPYINKISPLTISATDSSLIDNVTLYYRWSDDNLSWAPWTTLTYDDFESGFGNYTDGGADCELYTGGTYAHQGNNAADIQDNSGVPDSSFYHTSGIDVQTPGYNWIKVDFWFQTKTFSGSYNFYVEYYNGSAWQQIANYVYGTDFLNDQFYNKIILINNTSYTFPTNMQIRFTCNAWTNNEDVYIDEIYVYATTLSTSGNGINWTIWSNASNPDEDYPWSWNFDFPNMAGYYEFYSIGKKSGAADETPPANADARCIYVTLPVVYNEVPINMSTNIQLTPQTGVTVFNALGYNMNLTWRSNSSGSWQVFGVNNSVGNGIYYQTNSNFSNPETTYYWNVTADDGFNTADSGIFYFTTSNLPNISYPVPNNGSTLQSKTPICNVTITDTDGGNVTVSFYENTTGSWVLQQINSSVDVTTPANVTWNNYNNATQDTTTYWWKVNVSDGKGCYAEEIYYFTTANTSIDITPDRWDQGVILIGSSNETTGFYFNLTNNGNAQLYIQIKASNATNVSTSAQWTLNAIPSLDNFTLQYNKSGGGTWTVINLTYDLFISSLDIGSWQTFDLKLITAEQSTTLDPLSMDLTFRSIKT